MKQKPILSSGQEINKVDICDVSVLRNRIRPPNEANVCELVKSMAEVGMIEPIIVCRNGHGYDLVSGFHRLAAAQKLGWQYVDSIIVEVSRRHRRPDHSAAAWSSQPGCRQAYSPVREAQRWCCRACRLDAKAAEGVAARRAWWRAGRPMDEVHFPDVRDNRGSSPSSELAHVGIFLQEKDKQR